MRISFLRLKQMLGLAALLTLSCVSGNALAQSYTVPSITPVPDLGRVVSAASGDTIYRFAASSSNISKISGNAIRLTAGATRTLVTIACTNNNNCPNATTITITPGAATLRARAVSNFTVTANTGLTIGTITGTSGTISFPVTGIQKGGSGSFYLGMDMGVGDDLSANSGAATAAFTVAAANGSTSASATLTAIRPVKITENSFLSFGNVLSPTSGTNTITMGTGNDTPTISGAGNGRILGGAKSRATYSVSGEAAQIVNISTPATLSMAGPGGATISVNMVTSAATATLTGTAGQAATATFAIGGNFNVTSTTAPGVYTGTFNVTVQHN